MRILVSLKKLGKIVGLRGKKDLWRRVCAVCGPIFGVKPNYTTFLKHWDLVVSVLQGTGDLTFSTGSEEEVNSSSPEQTAEPEKPGAELEPKKAPPKLLTHRSNPAIQGKVHIHMTSAGIHTQLRRLSHTQLRQGENGRLMKEIIG